MRTLLQRYFVANATQKRRSMSQATCFLVEFEKIGVAAEAKAFLNLSHAEAFLQHTRSKTGALDRYIVADKNEKGIYGEKAAECARLMETFYCDNFKAVFDFANFIRAKEDTMEAYKLLKKYVAYIHVKDALTADGKVVPAGFGDGNVESVLRDLFASGFDGFLSLEPHLFEFTGFAGLEKDGKSMKITDGKILSGLEAFTLAYDSLMKILEKTAF